jgi:hypothetical protein
MCGVIVVVVGKSRSTNLGRDALIIALDIVIIIGSSINCPTVIVFPPFAIFLREATSEIYGPRGRLHHICFQDLFFIRFCFQIF